MRTSYDRMSAHDAGYLRRETPAQPLHYVLQLDVAGRVSYDEVLASLRPRLDEMPLAHRRTRYPLVGGRPVWIDDAAFTPERQVTPWHEELGGPAAVDAAFEELTLRRLPRNRPMWNLTVAQGPGDRTTLWLSVHHAMMDGALLTTMLAGLFPPAPPEVPPSPWRPRRAPSRLLLLVLVVLRRLARVLRRAPAAVPAPATPVLPTRLTGPVGPTRALADMTVRLSAVREARRRSGATLNDLFLATSTEALRDYLPDAPDVVVALVPRNVRTEAEKGVIGNRAWSMLVPLPTGEPDPVTRLTAIRAATAAGKQTDSTSGTQGWRFDIALTNVALGGPHAVAGRPVTGMRASVPLQGENRIVGVLLTHDDDLTVSFTADGAVYPDIARLAALTKAAWERLLTAPAAVT